MREDLHDLGAVEHRMRAVEAVQQVMGAVWALARAQQPLVEAAAAESSAYLSVAEGIVAQLAGAPRPRAPGEDVLWVLAGPERPFCGPLGRILLAQIPAAGRVGLVGRRLQEVAEQSPELPPRVCFGVPAASTPEEIGVCAEGLAAAILGSGYRDVVVLHPTDGSTEVVHSVILAGHREPVPEPPETFSPTEQVLEAAVTEAVEGRLAVALAEALRAEVRARLVASEAARRSSDKQLDALRHQWRVLRQGRITEELIELTAARPRER